jgi:hypothetical protein
MENLLRRDETDTPFWERMKEKFRGKHTAEATDMYLAGSPQREEKIQEAVAASDKRYDSPKQQAAAATQAAQPAEQPMILKTNPGTSPETQAAFRSSGRVTPFNADSMAAAQASPKILAGLNNAESQYGRDLSGIVQGFDISNNQRNVFGVTNDAVKARDEKFTRDRTAEKEASRRLLDASLAEIGDKEAMARIEARRLNDSTIAKNVAEKNTAAAAARRESLNDRQKMLDTYASEPQLDDKGNVKGYMVDPIKRAKLERNIMQNAAKRGIDLDSLSEVQYRALLAELMPAISVNDRLNAAQKGERGRTTEDVLHPDQVTTRNATFGDAWSTDPGNSYTMGDYAKSWMPFTSGQRDQVVVRTLPNGQKQMVPLNEVTGTKPLSMEELRILQGR